MIVHSAEISDPYSPEFFWRSGPSILTTFQVQDNSINRITLSPASTFSCKILGPGLKEEIFAWLACYLEGKEGPPLPLNFSPFTPFTQEGLKAIQKIPFGEVTTYGELAQEIGHPRGGRAIGNICHRNPFPLIVPCHRVIASDGSLRGFGYGLKMKQDMLQYESSRSH